MKGYSALLLAFSSVPAFGQQAPFCVITGMGGQPQCSHHILASCESAAKYSRGMCVANPAAFQQGAARPSMVLADPYGAYQRGQEDAARLHQQKEEHAAKMRLYEAQADALQRQQQGNQVSQPIYRCVDSQDTPYYTTVAAVGCAVIAAPSPPSES